MNKNIQNIFMDLKSYELIQDLITLDELLTFVFENVNPAVPKSISLCGHLFEVENHPKNDYLGFTYTVNTLYDICPGDNHFKNSIYLFSRNAMGQYGEDLSPITLLLFTTKKSICVSSDGGQTLKKIDCKTEGLRKVTTK